MKIKLLVEWMGHPKGAEITVAKSMGNRLIHQKVAVVPGAVAAKATVAPKDKMVKTAVTK